MPTESKKDPFVCNENCAYALTGITTCYLLPWILLAVCLPFGSPDFCVLTPPRYPTPPPPKPAPEKTPDDIIRERYISIVKHQFELACHARGGSELYEAGCMSQASIMFPSFARIEQMFDVLSNMTQEMSALNRRENRTSD